jgi:hypothetical protein
MAGSVGPTGAYTEFAFLKANFLGVM